MIETTLVKEHLEEILADAGCFLVDIKVDKSNRIMIQVDRQEGVSIENCVHISRQLEEKLDRDKEDFALEVSSPGLDSPFKVIEQYGKSLGNEVRVEMKEGDPIEGHIAEVGDKGIKLETGNGQSLSISFEKILSARRIIRI